MSEDYIVADLNLADWGRKEIRIAETESRHGNSWPISGWGLRRGSLTPG